MRSAKSSCCRGRDMLHRSMPRASRHFVASCVAVNIVSRVREAFEAQIPSKKGVVWVVLSPERSLCFARGSKGRSGLASNRESKLHLLQINHGRWETGGLFFLNYETVMTRFLSEFSSNQATIFSNSASCNCLIKQSLVYRFCIYSVSEIMAIRLLRLRPKVSE